MPAIQVSRRSFLFMAGAAGAARRPNIVLLLADDLGSADLSSYGCADIPTPHIDRIGRQGVRFVRFYANAPECTPTRTALLTGRYQQRVGGLECAIGVGEVGRYDEAAWLQQRGELGLPASETSLARVLKAHGYDTACIGKWHLGYRDKFSANRHGFDEYFGILGGNADYFTHREEDGRVVLYQNGKPVERKGYMTDLFAEEAVSWLKKRRGKPFFLYVPFTSPHTPIQDPDAFDPKTGTAPWDKGNRRVYAKMVARMDDRVGAILEQLRAMGVEENTMVIFSSDNGADPNGSNGRLRGRKGTLWEGGIRAPCLIRWPAMLGAGQVCAQTSITMDLTAMIAAAAGAAFPAGRKLDGVDLMPVLTGKKATFARTLFWRYKRLENRRKAVRDGDWKLVNDNGKEELHDLATDEREQKNLLAKEPERAAALRARLTAWEAEVAAPRLRDFRPAPAG